MVPVCFDWAEGVLDLGELGATDDAVKPSWWKLTEIFAIQE